MAKTIKNTKNKHKSTKSQKPTLKQDIKTIVDVLYKHRQCIEKLATAGQDSVNKMEADFKYHEDMRKIQDEYIESNFKTIRWLYIVLCALVVLLSVCTSIRTNKIETRLTQLEAIYEVGRNN